MYNNGKIVIMYVTLCPVIVKQMSLDVHDVVLQQSTNI